MKKLCALLLSVLAICTLAVACGKKNGGDSSVNDGDSSAGPSEEVFPETVVWGEWKLTEGAPKVSCTQDGSKTRTGIDSVDGSVKTQTVAIPAWGHEYAWEDSKSIAAAGGQGKCIRCGTAATIPALPEGQSFPKKSYAAGVGTAYNRFELTAGCFSVDVKSNGKSSNDEESPDLWLSFTIEGAGQYVLYSVGGDKGVTVRRCNITLGGATNYASGVDAESVDGNFYSYVSCPESGYNPMWRGATYAIETDSNVTLNLCFVRIDDAAWEAKTVNTFVSAKEIKQVSGYTTETGKALNAEEGKKPKEVDYETDYFYDEAIGYYRTGSKASPGEVIYVNLTQPVERMLGDNAFTDIIKNIGTALNVQDGQTIDGDHNVLSYIPFLLNCTDDNDPNGSAADTSKICYQNFCNADGMYPLNQELYRFLNLYVRQHTPIDSDIETEEWAAENEANPNGNKYFLAACYTYSNVKYGTSENPLVLSEGNNQIDIPRLGLYYCKVTGDGVFTLSCSTADIQLRFGDGNTEQNINDFTTINVQGGTVIRLSKMGGAACTVTVKVEQTTGSSNGQASENDAPANVIQTTNEEITLQPLTVYNADGSVEYFAYYTYTPTAAGTLTFTRTDSTAASVSVSGNALANGTPVTVSVTADEVTAAAEGEYAVVVYIEATAPDVSGTITIIFTPAA